jgi:hypothetical protein
MEADMRRMLISLLIFFLFVFQVHGQNISVGELINRCISLLDKPVPDGFRQINSQTFFSDEGILLFVNNEIVIVSSIHNTFRSNNEVNRYRTSFSSYLESNNWEFFRRVSTGADIYKKGDLSAIIESPRKLDNGSIEIMIGVSRKLLGLENM